MSSKLLSVCPLQNFMVKFYSVKNVFLASFSEIQQKFVIFFSKLFRSTWQSCILRVRKINLRTYLCFDKVFLCVFFMFFRTWTENHRFFFRRKTIGRFVTTAYHVSRGIFCRNFFWQSFSSFSALGIERTFSVISTEICWSRCQYCFLFVNSTRLWWKKVCLNLFFPQFLDIDRKNFGLCSNFFSAKLTTMHSTSPRDQVMDIKPFSQNFVCFIYHLRTLSGKIRAFFRKTIGRFVTTAYHVSRGMFCRIFLTKFFFFFIIGHWATFSGHFDGSLTVPLSVMFSVCQIDQFVEKKFLSKVFFPSFLDIDRKIIGLCSKFFQPSWRNCFLQARRINLKTNICFETF